MRVAGVWETRGRNRDFKKNRWTAVCLCAGHTGTYKNTTMIAPLEVEVNDISLETWQWCVLPVQSTSRPRRVLHT